MDMKYDMDNVCICIGLELKYALICLCVMHDMYMFIPELLTEYAAHSSQTFFFRTIVASFCRSLRTVFVHKYGWC